MSIHENGKTIKSARVDAADACADLGVNEAAGIAVAAVAADNAFIKSRLEIVIMCPSFILVLLIK